MTLKQAIDFWFTSAQRNLSAAKDLFKTKHYVECLFFCHLTIEKAIKGLTVYKTQKNPLPIHDLLKLAKDTGLNYVNSKLRLLAEINKFNIQARYDDAKFKLYKKATKEYTQKYLLETEELFIWLKEKL